MRHVLYWMKVAGVYALMVVAYGIACHTLGKPFQTPVVVISGIGVVVFGAIDVVKNGPVYRLTWPGWLTRLTRMAVPSTRRSA